jgi:hypothetical protein
MTAGKNISSSRRRFLFNGIKLMTLSAILLPVQKTLAKSAALIVKKKLSVRNFLLVDKLVLNTKTKVVHLPTEKIFFRYQDIDKKIKGYLTWKPGKHR